MPLPIPPSRSPLVTADGRPLDLVLAPEEGRSLLDILKSGQTYSGRVLERLANGSYLFTILGRTLVADSQLPLLPDAVVKFQVVNTGEQLALRLVDQPDPQAPRPTAADASTIARSLGLPATPLAARTLAAFQAAGAPLLPAALQTAMTAAAGVPDPTPLLSAHAVLARSGLPATPVLVAVATASVAGAAPDLAVGLGRLQNLLAGLPPEVQGRIRQALNAAAPVALAPPAPTGTGEAPLAGRGITASPLPTASVATPGLALVPSLPGPDPQAQTAVRALLARSGLRPEAQPSEPGSSRDPTPLASDLGSAPHRPLTVPPTLIHDLAELARTLDGLRPGSPPTSEAQATLRAAAAEMILPPPHLNDYDLVLPLVAAAMPGVIRPGRVAVARRRNAAGQEAVFLRVDTELDALGQVSLRFSGLAGAAIAILLMANGRALVELEAQSAAIQTALAGQGITATVRTAPLACGVWHG